MDKNEKMYNALLQRVQNSAYLRCRIAKEIQALYGFESGWRVYIWFDGEHVEFSEAMSPGYGGKENGNNPLAFVSGCDATRREILKGLREEPEVWLQLF